MFDSDVQLTRPAPASLIARERELAWCAHAFACHRVLVIYGLPGIGKTSLMLTAAHEQARHVAGTVAYHVCTEGERIGSVLASILARRPAVPGATSLRAALDGLAEFARRTPLVVCLDDAHCISDPLLLGAVAHLGAIAAPLWVMIAARRQLPLAEAEVDGAVLHLRPLAVEGARALWDDLEERFGPSIVRFDKLDPARRGSPFALRRAFAADPGGHDDGVDLTGLAGSQASLLALLCAFHGPVDVERLTALSPDRMAVLPALLRTLLVEVRQPGTITVHDLVRAGVARSARPPTPAEHLVCLSYYEAGDNDLLGRLRHTVGAERWSAAAELIHGIVRPHYGFFPMGAALETEVLAAFRALENARVELPLLLRLARLQLAARHGDGRAVLESLQGEAAREPAAWAHLGTVELLLGDAPAAEVHIRQSLSDPSVAAGPVVQAFLLAILLEALRTQGKIAALCDALNDFEGITARLGPIGAGVAQVMIAAISYDREDYEDAAARLASARSSISLMTFVPALQAAHALLERAACAALVDSPYRAPSPSTVTRALFEDVDFLRATLLLFAADGDVIQGNIHDAEARARDAEAITERAGYRGIRQWAVYVRTECLRMRGFAAAASELADRALRDPQMAVHSRQRLLLLAISALSLSQLGRMDEARRRVESIDKFVHAPVKAARLSILPWIERPTVQSDLARAELALAQLERALIGGQLEHALRWSDDARIVRRSSWHYLRARLAVLDAELAIRIGDAAQAELALADAEALCAERGYGRERATAALLAVALARLVNAADRATSWAERAAERAAGISFELEAAANSFRNATLDSARSGSPWIDRLELGAPRLFRLRERTTVRYLTKRQADAVRFTDGTFGVDAVRHTVHMGGVERSFARRPGLWSVLSALLIEPGRVMSPDDLARHAWGVGYHAIRHRSRLVVSIKRLRDDLHGEVIATVDGGYCLSTQTWAVLEAGQPATRESALP